MSGKAIVWARGQRCGSGVAKAVLVALAGYASESGRAFPSQRRLCDETEFGERTVRDALKLLERQGKIRREVRRRSDGTRTSDAIVLLIPDQPAAPAASGNINRRLPPLEGASTGGSLPQQPAAPAGLTTFEISEEEKARVFVRRGAPGWAEWQAIRRTPTNANDGWWFPSRYPTPAPTVADAPAGGDQ